MCEIARVFRSCTYGVHVLSFRLRVYLPSLQDVSSRDIPLLKFMSTMAAALGMEGIFCMVETLLPSPDGVKHEGHAPNSSSLENASGGDAAESVPLGGTGSPWSAWESGGLAIQGVLSRGAATEFYQNFLVPRLLRTAGGDGGGETAGAVAAASAVVLKSLTERFLLAGGGECVYVLHRNALWRVIGSFGRCSIGIFTERVLCGG